MTRTILIACAALLLAACGERAQTNSSSYKPDQKSWQSQASPYQVKGYKGNDKAAWDTQMRQRIQGQNEYQRVN